MSQEWHYFLVGSCVSIGRRFWLSREQPFPMVSTNLTEGCNSIVRHLGQQCAHSQDLGGVASKNLGMRSSQSLKLNLGLPNAGEILVRRMYILYLLLQCQSSSGSVRASDQCSEDPRLESLPRLNVVFLQQFFFVPIPSDLLQCCFSIGFVLLVLL